MRIDILSLFPAMFKGILESSILAIALEKKLVDIWLTDIRNFSYASHRNVDDRPYAGGPGMLLKPEPIFRAVESIPHNPEHPPLYILLTPQGEVFQQKTALELSQKEHLVLICGHYEGFDERIRLGLKPREISIGDYVLTGGEIPAMVLVDSIARLIPGVLGDIESTEHESFSNGLLEYPQYTRPPVFRGMEVPEILYSGHHKKIEEWKKQKALERTILRRPDLMKNAAQNSGENA
ncbi:MAG: tRNA (guanosine(37)-N1)-methyltransferase TrmD [Candidatus Brocadiae bacterium]|nr:tRNA (guanosine(37)-N1)-methyltransferase TrmD [Candidatus Brocadiia bacterium]